MNNVQGDTGTVDKRPVKLVSVIIHALAAAVWTLNCVLLAMYRSNDRPSGILLALNVVCAVTWWSGFVRAAVRYCKNKQRKD